METTETVMGKWVKRQEVDHMGPPGPPVLPCGGVECPQACLSRPGCRETLESLLSRMPCFAQVGREALGDGGSVLVRPPSIAWQQWEGQVIGSLLE